MYSGFSPEEFVVHSLLLPLFLQMSPDRVLRIYEQSQNRQRRYRLSVASLRLG